jgi:prevent-host-death family protein
MPQQNHETNLAPVEARTTIRISVANLRRSLADTLYRVRYGNYVIIVYSHRKPSAVIIPFEQAERLRIVQNDK